MQPNKAKGLTPTPQRQIGKRVYLAPLLGKVKRFARADSGAITVEWVAWAVAVVFLIAAFFTTFPAELTQGVNSIF